MTSRRPYLSIVDQRGRTLARSCADLIPASTLLGLVDSLRCMAAATRQVAPGWYDPAGLVDAWTPTPLKAGDQVIRLNWIRVRGRNGLVRIGLDAGHIIGTVGICGRARNSRGIWGVIGEHPHPPPPAPWAALGIDYALSGIPGAGLAFGAAMSPITAAIGAAWLEGSWRDALPGQDDHQPPPDDGDDET